MTAMLPPSGFSERTQVFWDRHVTDLFVRQRRNPFTIVPHSTQMYARTDEQQRVDAIRLEIPAYLAQLRKCPFSRIASNNDALRVPGDIDKEMAITGRQPRREFPQVQVLESEAVHAAHFESTDTQNQSRGDSLVKKLQTINLSFRATSENENHIRPLRRIFLE